MATNRTALIIPPPATSRASSLASTNDIRPAKPPVPISSGWEWLWWTLGVLAVAALAFFLARWLMKKKSSPPAPPVPPHVRARRRLAEALRLIQEPKPFCTAVSDALRVYLEERFDFRAPERTTDEFLVELQATNRLTDLQKASLGDFLQSCDLVKFARFEPNEQALRELHEAALRLVDETQFDPVSPPALTAAVGAATRPAGPGSR